MLNSIFPIFSGTSFIGTGFCIHYDNNSKFSYILTCYHVIKNSDDILLEPLTVYGEILEEIVSEKNCDMAILKINKVLTPLKLHSDKSVQKSYLYSIKDTNYNTQIGEQVSAKICQDSLSSTYYTAGNSIDIIRLKITDENSQTKLGNSGSPIFCSSTKRVVAMANIRLDDKVEKAFAIDIAYLKDIWKDMPEKLVDNSLDRLLEEIKEPQKIIIGHLLGLGVDIENLLDACREFLDENYINATLIGCTTVEEIINKIVNNRKENSLICIVKSLNSSHSDIEAWLSNNNFNTTLCTEIKAKNKKSRNPKLVLLFKDNIEEGKGHYLVNFTGYDLSPTKENKDKYNTPFRGGSLNADSNNEFNLKDEEDKIELVKRVRELIKQDEKKEQKTVEIDIILPYQLMVENIKLWSIGRKKLCGSASKVNIRNADRYKLGEINLETLTKNWKDNIITPYLNEKILEVLHPIEEDADIDKLHDEIKCAGLAIKSILTEEDFDFLQEEFHKLNYIMLWRTSEDNGVDNFDWIKDKKLNCLCESYYTSDRYLTPTNLMYDDPNTYYYPDKQQQGEQNG